MTWNGAQETFTVKNMGVCGNAHTEGGLTYAEFYFSEFVPWAAFSTVSYLLGKQDSPSN
ncbi:hypothetical protein B0H12DRAFT_1118756 [Mycena haematopus]|nr:hypothetical protein B0H12DRAFT_1118756 [Mycena haematopus]